jgi:hypothetical protein
MRLACWDQSVYIITVTHVRVHNSVLPVTILATKTYSSDNRNVC